MKFLNIPSSFRYFKPLKSFPLIFFVALDQIHYKVENKLLKSFPGITIIPLFVYNFRIL